jgi:hypothetical protein
MSSFRGTIDYAVEEKWKRPNVIGQPRTKTVVKTYRSPISFYFFTHHVADGFLIHANLKEKSAPTHRRPTEYQLSRTQLIA